MSLEQAILTHAAALTRLADVLAQRPSEPEAHFTKRPEPYDLPQQEVDEPQPEVRQPKPAKSKPVTVDAEVTKANEAELTYDDLKRPFVDCAKKNGVVATLARLAPFGNPKALHELEHKPEVWGAVLAALQE